MIFSSGFNLCRLLLFVYINLSWIQLSEREGWAPFNQFTPYFCVCPNLAQCVVGFCVINCLKWEVIAHLVDIGTPSTATDFRFVFIILHITMLTSSWPPVVCRRVHVLFTLFVVSNTYCVVFLFCLSSSCVWCIVVSNTYCVVFLFCLSSSCVWCMVVSNTYCLVFLFCLSSSCVPDKNKNKKTLFWFGT